MIGYERTATKSRLINKQDRELHRMSGDAPSSSSPRRCDAVGGDGVQQGAGRDRQGSQPARRKGRRRAESGRGPALQGVLRSRARLHEDPRQRGQQGAQPEGNLGSSKVSGREKALADEIRVERAGAQQGDVFSPCRRQGDWRHRRRGFQRRGRSRIRRPSSSKCR